MNWSGGWRVALLAVATSLGAAEPEEIIRFERPSRIGQELACRLEGTMEMKVTRYLADERNEESVESFNLKMDGTMRVDALTERGQAAKAVFKGANATVRVGEKNYAPAWAGKTIEIDFTKSPACGFSILGGEALTAQDVRLLSMFFHPATGETMADWLGQERKAAPGESWALNTDGLRQQMASQGMTVKPEQISGKAILKERKTIGKFPCWEVTIDAATQGVPDYEFTMSGNMLLPVDERHGIIRVERRGREVVLKKMPPGEPLALNLKGLRIEVASWMTGEMMPLPEKTPGKPDAP